MATEVERLLVRLEVTQRKFEKQLADANRTADRRARNMQRSFVEANRHISRSFERMSRTASVSFQSVSRLAVAAVASLGVKTVVDLADAWTQVENQIRAAEQISGTQARTMSGLNDIANETRSGLSETANLYARLIRVSGQLGASEEQVAQVTRTVAQAFKAGGAAASEQEAAVLQLSQALASGELMGEELRSIRENAPLLAQAIAEEFGVTIGQLKELGSEGELTADRVFRAILNGQKNIADAFAVTTPTISDGLTVMWNGMRELVAALDDGSGASDALVAKLANMGSEAEANVAAAQRFGAQLAEAVGIIGESAKAASEWAATQQDAFGQSSVAAADYLRVVLDVFKTIISESAGVAALISAAIQSAVKLVADGAVGMANGAVSAVETMINGIIAGINKLISAMNTVSSSVNGLPGVNIGQVGQIGSVSLSRVGSSGVEAENPMDAYSRTREGVRGALDAMEDQAVGIIRRVQRAGETPYDPNDPRGNQKAGLTRPADGQAPAGIDTTTPTAVGAGGASDGGGKGRKGRKGKEEDPFFLASDKELENLKRQIAMIGLTGSEIAELEAKYRLLDEAKERGLALDAKMGATGETLREQIDRQAAAIGNLTEKYEKAEERASFYSNMQGDLKDGMLDVIVAGESLSGVLENVAQSMAKALLQASLFGDGPFGTGGGGIFGGILSAFGGSGGGASAGGAIAGALNSAITGRAAGGRVKAGVAHEVGEHGREIFVPETNGRILNASQAQQAMRGRGGAAGANVSLSWNIDATGADSAELKRTQAQLRRIEAEIPNKVRSTLRQDGNQGRARKVMR